MKNKISILLIALYLSCKSQVNTFPLGDLNNDKLRDTAFIKSNYNEVAKTIKIEFKNLPDIIVNHSTNIFIRGTIDVNNDNCNEILIFSKTNQEFWNDLYLYSYNNKWEKLAQTKVLVDDKKAMTINRISKKNNKFYLVGENMWENDTTNIGDKKWIEIKTNK